MLRTYVDKIRIAGENLIDFLPQLLLAILLFAIGHWLIRKLRKRIFRRILARSGERLSADFISSIIGIVFYLILTVFCLNILGFNSLISKILAGAGLTAFIIGFALKDIGENFLSGIVMVFDRPFRTNDIIEIDGKIGRIISVSLRETVIKSLDGKDIYIPNATILKNPLQNYTIDDVLRNSFSLYIFNDNDIRRAIQIIQDTMVMTEGVLDTPTPSVTIDGLENGVVKLLAFYWYDLQGTRSINNDMRSEIMLKILETFKNDGIVIPNQIQDIKINN